MHVTGEVNMSLVRQDTIPSDRGKSMPVVNYMQSGNRNLPSKEGHSNSNN